MEYEEDTRQAYLTDEVDRVLLENSGMFALSNGRKPQYAGLAVAEPEVTLTDLDDDDLDGAMAELASQRGLTLTDVAGQVLVLSGGERDTHSRAIALLELAALDEDTALSLTVSTEKRDELADKGKGWALPDGSFPVHDAKHVGAAKAYFKQSKLAGHPAHVVKAHINKAAARLGLPGLYDDDGDEDGADREVARRRKPRASPRTPQSPGTPRSPCRWSAGASTRSVPAASPRAVKARQAARPAAARTAVPGT